jgi:glycosidase
MWQMKTNTKHMKKSVIYQVLPRLFGNTNTTNKLNGRIDENGCGKFDDFTPTALKQIKDLGVTHIWYAGVIEHAQATNYEKFKITPDPVHIVKGQAGSPYAIKDYFDVDPDLANDVPKRMKEFEALVNRTHQAEMKVIIDFVPNHLARHYESDAKPKGIVDFGANDNTDVDFSSQNNFYYLVGQSFVPPIEPNESTPQWNENPAKVTGNDCLMANPGEYDWYETVKLNYGVNIFNDRSLHIDPIPDTWLKMKEVLLYWANKKVDGFRCDMAEMVPIQFWSWVIQEIKTVFPNIIFIGEVYQPILYKQFISEGHFDLLYDKVGMYDTLKRVVLGESPVSEITNAWERVATIHHQMLFFTENHDEQRIASNFFAGDAEKGWPATFVSATINSNPFMLYFGQEVGVDGMDKEGFSGLDGRTTIFDYWGIRDFQNWVNDKHFDGGELTSAQKILRSKHQKLFELLDNESAIYDGNFYDLMWFNSNSARYNSQSVYSFLRHNADSVLLIVVNFADNVQDLRIRLPQEIFHICNLNTEGYFKSFDLMGSSTLIQFPAQIAVHGGIGLSIEANTGCIFKLK